MNNPGFCVLGISNLLINEYHSCEKNKRQIMRSLNLSHQLHESRLAVARYY